MDKIFISWILLSFGLLIVGCKKASKKWK